MAFCKEYNAKTADKAGEIIPVEITVYDGVSKYNLLRALIFWDGLAQDKSFTFVLKTPPASALLKKAAGVGKGCAKGQGEVIGSITTDQLR
eukprot:7890181-Pyramimonas_sp.AAC.1